MPPLSVSVFSESPNVSAQETTSGVVGIANMSTIDTKKSLNAVVGSLEAVLNLLEVHGVEFYRVKELRRQVDRKDYVGVMECAQELAEGLESGVTSTSRHSRSVEVNTQSLNALAPLFVSAWECLSQYMSGLYHDAFKNFHALRKEKLLHRGNPIKDRRQDPQIVVQRAMELQNELAERCMKCQKGLILVRMWEKSLLSRQRQQKKQ